MALAAQREVLESLGFAIVSTERGITAVRRRWHWDCVFTRVTYVVFVQRVDLLTAHTVNEDRSRLEAEAKKLGRSWLPRGFQAGVAIFACYIADHVDESGAKACLESSPGFAKFYLPVARDRSAHVSYFIRRTPVWGGLYYGKFRYLAARMLSPREPHGREPLSAGGVIITVLLAVAVLVAFGPRLLRPVTVSGCRSDAVACTRETFAKESACSTVDVHERSDIHASDFPEFIAAHAGDPPPEVQSDPERLQRWLSEIKASRTLVEALKAKLDDDELIARFESAFGRRISERTKKAAGGDGTAPRIRDCERRIANLTEALAKAGWSDALATKLREEEGSLRKLKTLPATRPTARLAPDAATLIKLRKKLFGVLEADVVRGRELLSRYLSPVIMTPIAEGPSRGYRVTGAFNLSYFLDASGGVSGNSGCAGAL